jgi:hypothetical protein
MIRIFKTMLVPAGQDGCVMWSLTLKETHRKVLELEEDAVGE